jgi:hypothetical protein
VYDVGESLCFRQPGTAKDKETDCFENTIGEHVDDDPACFHGRSESDYSDMKVTVSGEGVILVALEP